MVAGLQEKDSDAPRKVSYGSKKKSQHKKGPAAAAVEESKEAEVPAVPEPAQTEVKAPEVEAAKAGEEEDAEDVKDDWDASSDEEQKAEVKDDWDASSEDEKEEVKAATSPAPTPAPAKGELRPASTCPPVTDFKRGSQWQSIRKNRSKGCASQTDGKACNEARSSWWQTCRHERQGSTNEASSEGWQACPSRRRVVIGRRL